MCLYEDQLAIAKQKFTSELLDKLERQALVGLKSALQPKDARKNAETNVDLLMQLSQKEAALKSLKEENKSTKAQVTKLKAKGKDLKAKVASLEQSLSTASGGAKKIPLRQCNISFNYCPKSGNGIAPAKVLKQTSIETSARLSSAGLSEAATPKGEEYLEELRQYSKIAQKAATLEARVVRYEN